MSNLRYILDSDFRSNPGYELIEWNRLSQPEQQSLAGLCEDPEVFGIFKPTIADPTLSYKVAYKEVALLFYVLQQQSALPAYTRIDEIETVNKQIARLVMEGILEIRGDDEFYSGAAAHDLLYKRAAAAKGVSLIGQLSIDALRYAAHLPVTDIRALASRLYSYNTRPVLAEKAAGLSRPADVEAFLGVGKTAVLGRDWEQHTGGKWLYWSRKGMRGSSGENISIYKLYISPVFELLPETFQKSIAALTASRAFSFKVGNDFHGLVRPDKMVVYFYTREDLFEAAASLWSALDNITPQGVPFTAQLDDSGLLSWGVDPPGRDVLENFEGGSWRARVTERLAAALAKALGEGLPLQEIVDYALNRIGLEGIDTNSWIPEKNIWKN